KSAKYGNVGQKLRHGYCDGSHSEIEVSQYAEWGPDQIRERGVRLLKFMETRWEFSFLDDDQRDRLLFLGNGD
ncbi:MAG: hypothetical protein ACYCOU_23225, partial [Sulfobacillus sp.]